MGYIDFVLNLAGLLLWFQWRSLGFVTAPSALSLAAAVRPADKPRGGRSLYLLLLAILLLLRTLFYWKLGSSLDWTPKLPLGIFVISLKCESLARYALFSLLSFGLALAVFYCWLLLLSALPGRSAETDPLTRLVRQHLGPVAGWPGWLQVVLPCACAPLLWPLARWIFTVLDAMPAKSGWSLLRESLGMGFAPLLAWEYLVAGLLLLHFLNTYVYFGANSFWDYVQHCGRRLLTPLRWLRFGKLDFAPLVGIILVIGLCEGIARWTQWLPDLEKRFVPPPVPAYLPASTNQ